MANWIRFGQSALVVATLFVQASYGAEPTTQSTPATEPNTLQRLLELAPQNSESLFCVNAPFAVTERDDLTITSLFETASYLTTVLSARLKAVAGLEMPDALCAISAVRDIELPKPDPRTHVCSGLFRSKRCELILTADKLSPDWFAPRKETTTANVEIAGYPVIEIVNVDEKIMVLALASDLICVSNDKLFLSEVLALASGKQTASIEGIPAFSAAAALISQDVPFWSVRLFSGEPSAEDPTSIRNAKSVIGLHDPEALFIAMELPPANPKTLQVHYASQAGRDATDRFAISLLGKMVQNSHSEEWQGKTNREPKYVVTSLNCDMKRYGDEPVLAFIVIAALWGQGLLL